MKYECFKNYKWKKIRILLLKAKTKSATIRLKDWKLFLSSYCFDFFFQKVYSGHIEENLKISWKPSGWTNKNVNTSSLGISASMDTSIRQRGEPGQALVPIPPLKQTNIRKYNFIIIWPHCIGKVRSQEKKKKTRRARRPQEGREVTLVIWPWGHLFWFFQKMY